jgi:thiamine kinase-like enzyme
MMKAPDDLWPLGTYWHLDTRPDEWAVLEDQALKDSASAIDKALRDCPYQSFVHGDAKLANFCFTKQSKEVAAVDFQYVGGGCGMKDLAYFIGSCLAEDECKNHEMDLLDAYFIALDQALTEQKSAFTGSEVEQAWRPLFKYAWADFHRFLKGWSPGHWKLNTYSERLTREVLDEINGS